MAILDLDARRVRAEGEKETLIQSGRLQGRLLCFPFHLAREAQTGNPNIPSPPQEIPPLLFFSRGRKGEEKIPFIPRFFPPSAISQCTLFFPHPLKSPEGLLQPHKSPGQKLKKLLFFFPPHKPKCNHVGTGVCGGGFFSFLPPLIPKGEKSGLFHRGC